MKKKLKVLVLFDGTSPTTVDQDFTKELKTKDWKTEADVMAALGEVGHAAEHLAILLGNFLGAGLTEGKTATTTARRRAGRPRHGSARKHEHVKMSGQVASYIASV